MRLASYALIFTLYLSAAFAQYAVVEGTVTDAHTREPLPGASVLFDRNQGTVSNADGFYRFSRPSGKVIVRFQYMGYKSTGREITLAAGDTITLDMALEPDITQIDQVVVSAGRVEQRVAESTVSMSIITPQQYSAAHITDSRELINKTPGIEVIDGQAAVRGGSGFSYGAGSRVLTLLDGLPVLAADAGSIRWQFLPLENISQIEIIKGASSVLYGSSALNGVINFRSARATEIGRTSFFVETGIFDSPPNPDYQWWGSPRIFNTASLSHLKKYGNTEVGAGAFVSLDKGYRRLNHEDTYRFNVNIRHDTPALEGLHLGVNAIAGYTDKRDFVLWEDAQRGALRQDESTSINLRGTFLAIDPFVGLRSEGNYTHDVRMRFQLTDNQYPDATNNESTAISFLTEYQAWYNINRFLNINAGLLQNASRVLSAFYGDHDALNLAVYLQGDFSPVQRLKIVGGIRLEHNSLNGESDDLVPLFRAGANYMAGNYTFLRASWGQGYRYPSIAEKHAATTLGAVRIFPNLLLQPESGWNAEVGVKQGVVALNWDGMVDVALFYSQNKDLIEYLFGIFPDPVSGLSMPGFRADNTEYSRVYGVETEFFFTRKTGWFENTVSGGYLYTFPVEFNRSTGKNTDTWLKYRRKHSATLSLSSRYRNFEPGIDLFYRSKTLNIDDVFVNPGTREDILPGFYDYWLSNNTGYFLMDFHLGYQINPVYRVSVAVKNLTNTEYMGRPGDIRPHRNFSLRISAVF
ncbi:MAG: TonB-dependent receptor [Bacteroidetes bacterium]|nr:MAG: TonB-dependent receptor [Bacteroidota bacterium]